MPLNTACIGREYPTGPVYEVGREKIKEFAAAIGDTNPIYSDESAAKAAGYSDIVAPPTFLTAIGFKSPSVVADPDLGLDYTRVVHGEQEFELRRPLHPGDRLRATPKIVDIAAKGSNEFLTYELRIATEAGEDVAVARSIIVSRGTAPKQEG